MQQNSHQPDPISADLVRSIILLICNGAMIYLILSSVFSEIASSGALWGQALLARLLPGLSLLTAFAGSVLAYVTMGLIPAAKVRPYQKLSAVLFVVTLVLLLTRIFGPLFGLA